jgi:hypothetical protein
MKILGCFKDFDFIVVNVIFPCKDFSSLLEMTFSKGFMEAEILSAIQSLDATSRFTSNVIVSLDNEVRMWRNRYLELCCIIFRNDLEKEWFFDLVMDASVGLDDIDEFARKSLEEHRAKK